MPAYSQEAPRPVLAGADSPLRLAELQAAYASRTLSVVEVVGSVYRALERLPKEAALFISLRPEAEALAEAHRLDRSGADGLPLFGAPFAVKDNIDVAGVETTAACPAFAYRSERSARVVERLLAAGGLYIGKTNLDQFATGLSGVRSPYGAVASAYQREHIAGGSSSGSAVAVAAGLVSFALGTDTGGSGRIPAGFNHVVGLKPSLGRVSGRGVLPNCRSLDCVSVFTSSVADAESVLRVIEGYDPLDPFSRPPTAAARRSVAPRTPPTLGVPRELSFFGDDASSALFAAALRRLERLGVRLREIDFAPYQEAGELLFGGPHVAERLTAIDGFVKGQPEALHPVTRRVLASARQYSATELFAAQHRQRALQRRVYADFHSDEGIDALLVPTAPRPYTLAELEADPITLNHRLGHYSYFANLLDLCAVAVPNGFLPSGVPMGVTLLAPRDEEAQLLALATRIDGRGGEAPPAARPARAS